MCFCGIRENPDAIATASLVYWVQTQIHQHRKLRQMLPRRRLILLSCVMILLVVKRTILVAQVCGDSMAPTLRKGDYILGIRVPHRPGLLWQMIRSLFIKREAIVLVRPPAHLGRLEVKRIEGLPGDTRSWGWGTSLTGPHRVPDNHIFLVGDASRHIGKFTGPPADSRLYGPCPSIAIVARVLFRLWPMGCVGYPRNRLNVSGS